MFSKKVKIIINVITIVALIILLVVSWPDIQEGFKEIGGAKWSILALIIPIKLFGFYSIAMLYYSYLKSYGYKKINKWAMYKVSLELNFVNSVFPSGGVAGFTYLGYRMQHYNVPAARTTLAQTLRFVLTFISFLLLLFIGLFMLSFGDTSSGVTLFIGLSIAFLTLFGTLALVFIISDEKRIKSFAAFLPRIVNSLFRIFNKRKPAINVDKIEKLFGEMHDDYSILMRDRKKIRRPLFWALLINISEVLAMYTVYLALGQFVNPGAVILAYSVASFAGLISILPGGIGVYEALMTTTLTASGVPKALALSATLIYRIITMVAFVPVGFIFYQLALKKGEAEEVHSDGSISTDTD